MNKSADNPLEAFRTGISKERELKGLDPSVSTSKDYTVDSDRRITVDSPIFQGSYIGTSSDEEFLKKLETLGVPVDDNNIKILALNCYHSRGNEYAIAALILGILPPKTNGNGLTITPTDAKNASITLKTEEVNGREFTYGKCKTVLGE